MGGKQPKHLMADGVRDGPRHGMLLHAANNPR